jgi:hypothetical protein
MTSTCSNHGSLEVVNEGLLEILPGVDGFLLETFDPSKRYKFQGYWEIEHLGGVGST